MIVVNEENCITEEEMNRLGDLILDSIQKTINKIEARDIQG